MLYEVITPHSVSPKGREEVVKWFNSEEIAIGHILLEPETINYLKQNIIFKEALSKDLKDFLENPSIVITSYSIHYTKLYDYFFSHRN